MLTDQFGTNRENCLFCPTYAEKSFTIRKGFPLSEADEQR